jgi:hypothetical protein
LRTLENHPLHICSLCGFSNKPVSISLRLRYYLGQFRDTYRQSAFNLIHGVEDASAYRPRDVGEFDPRHHQHRGSQGQLIPEGPRRLNSGCAVPGGDNDLSPAVSPSPGLTSDEVIERVKALLIECQAELVPDPSTVLGAWGLIDADPA